MTQKILVIGMGLFGSSVARSLIRRGVDVTILDSEEENVRQLSAEPNRVVIADATDEKVLRELRVETFSAIVNAIGADFLEGSILCTALLRQLGARRVLARAVSPLHERILLSLGVYQVIQPESLIAERTALQLAAPGLLGIFALSDDVAAVEVEIPETWVGKTLLDLNLRREYGVTVVALRRMTTAGKSQFIPSPKPDDPLLRGEVALLVGDTEQVERFLTELQ